MANRDGKGTAPASVRAGRSSWIARAIAVTLEPPALHNHVFLERRFSPILNAKNQPLAGATAKGFLERLEWSS